MTTGHDVILIKRRLEPCCLCACACACASMTWKRSLSLATVLSFPLGGSSLLPRSRWRRVSTPTHTKRYWNHLEVGLSATLGNILSLEKCLDLYQNDESTIFVDGSWYHKGDRSGRGDFQQGPRIPKSRFLDIQDIIDSKTPSFPITEQNNTLLIQNMVRPSPMMMLPSPDTFAHAMDMLGITPANRVVIYGREGASFLPRVWFTFREMGHAQVHLMQGSLEDWSKAGGPVDRDVCMVPLLADWMEESAVNHHHVTPDYQGAQVQNKRVVDLNYMKDYVSKGKGVLVDARGSSYAKGHIPGAKHIPYSSLTTGESTTVFREVAELRQIFTDAGVDLSSAQPVVCTCGSGVSACSLFLALEECGRTDNVFMYDGSWSEWKQYDDLPRVIPSST